MIRVVVIDDDKLVALSLKTILEASEKTEVVGIGSDGTEAQELFEKYRPDVLLMDIQMKEVSGLTAGQKILDLYHDAKILFLTTFSDDEYIVKALRMGAKGYILKQDFEGIVSALEAVCMGQTVFGTQVVDKLPDLLSGVDHFAYDEAKITEKEFEIIEMVAQGMSNKEISEASFLSEGTIRNYLSSILNKLELRDRTQLAIFYYQHQ